MATENKTTTKCKTRLAAGGVANETALEIVWDGTDEQMRMFATRGVVIAAQSIMRATGDIPDTLTVSVAELAKRERGGFAMKATPENALRLIGKLDDAAMTTALTQLGMSKSDIARASRGEKSAREKVALVPYSTVARIIAPLFFRPQYANIILCQYHTRHCTSPHEYSFAVLAHDHNSSRRRRTHA